MQPWRAPAALRSALDAFTATLRARWSASAEFWGVGGTARLQRTSLWIQTMCVGPSHQAWITPCRYSTVPNSAVASHPIEVLLGTAAFVSSPVAAPAAAGQPAESAADAAKHAEAKQTAQPLNPHNATHGYVGSGSGDQQPVPQPTAGQQPPPVLQQPQLLKLLQQDALPSDTLCRLATALSQQQHHYPAVWVLLALRCTEAVPTMTPEQATAIATAFAAAGHYNQAVLDAACQVATEALVAANHMLAEPAVGLPASAPGAPSEAAEHAEQQRALQQASPAAAGALPPGCITPQQLVAMCSACHKLRHHTLAFLKAVAAASQRCSHLMTLDDLIQVVEACSHLNYYSMPLFSMACQRALRALQDCLSSTREQQQQQQQQQLQHHPHHQQQYQQHQQQQQQVPFPGSSTDSSRNTGWASTVTGHVSGSMDMSGEPVLGGTAFRKQHPAAAAISSKDSSATSASVHYSPGELLGLVTRLVWSCCSLQHMDVSLLKASLQLVSAVDANAVSPGGSSSSGGGGGGGSTLSSSSSSSSSEQRSRVLNRQQLSRWYEVSRMVTDAAAVHQDLLRAVQWPHQLLVSSQQAWVSSQQAAHMSQFQQDVLATLQAMGQRCYANVPTNDGQCMVDIILQWGPMGAQRKTVALLLDGPQQFSANTPHVPLGPTVQRWHALQHRGWQVFSLRYSDWARLKDDQQRQQFLYAAREAAESQLRSRSSAAGSGGGVVVLHTSSSSSSGDSSRGADKGVGTTKLMLKRLWHLFIDA